jgi:hypothetical protein
MENYPKIVLLEFQFTNRNLIPPSAKRIIRNEITVVKKRQSNGVATGEHGQADKVTVKPFVRQLFGLGYKIADLHFYVKANDKAKGRKTRFVLVVNFARNGAIKFLTKDDLEILGQLIDRDAWGYFHLWKNPNGVMSVYCLHRVPDGANIQGVGEFLLESSVEEGFVYEDVMQT